eukprot:TRINITY_DN893_c0_g1_i1.p1 TRINITY_DN893_c0_g1~~TRINITY_DN893_c0_g1_i1.p1  ORF type:complete len:154 (+),score=37.14 TRINITY_DN893_c0_g1_i1:72-533(+)
MSTFDNRYSSFWKQRVQKENAASQRYVAALNERRVQELEHSSKDGMEEFQRLAESTGLKMEDMSKASLESFTRMRLPPIKTTEEDLQNLRTKQRTTYLKEKGTMSPLQRHGQPLTSSHAVGWEAQWSELPPASPYSKRPTVREEFYRNRGITH